MSTITTIYTVMVAIMSVSRTEKYPMFMFMVVVMVLSSISYSIQLIISCLICGSIGDRIVRLNAILDNIDQKVLSDKAYKEWLTFATVMRNTRTFGFTIGGFATLNKSTLIAVIIIFYL